MAWNGSGGFPRLYDWTDDRDADIKIRADRMDAEMDGFATGLEHCLTVNGETVPTANLPMGGFKHTGAADATGAGQYMTYGQTNTALALKAPLAYPTFTGTVTLAAGAVLSTPASGTLTNCTGLPVATGISGLGTGVATFLATPSSANLAAALTDETGSGANVFATAPTMSAVTVTGGLTASTSGAVTTAIAVPLVTSNGSTSSQGILVDGTVQTTGTIAGVKSAVNTFAASFTATARAQLYAVPPSKGAGTTITSDYGAWIDGSGLSGAANYGLAVTGITAGSANWNIYASGSAPNLLVGPTRIGAAGSGMPSTYSLEAINSSSTGSTMSVYNSHVDGDSAIDFMDVGGSTIGATVGFQKDSGGGQSTLMFNLKSTDSTAEMLFYFGGAAVYGMKIKKSGSVVIGGVGANATTDTGGYLYIPSCAGTPTGVPTAISGKIAIVYDSTNNKIYAYNGAWKATAALT